MAAMAAPDLQMFQPGPFGNGLILNGPGTAAIGNNPRPDVLNTFDLVGLTLVAGIRPPAVPFPPNLPAHLDKCWKCGIKILDVNSRLLDMVHYCWPAWSNAPGMFHPSCANQQLLLHGQEHHTFNRRLSTRAFNMLRINALAADNNFLEASMGQIISRAMDRYCIQNIHQIPVNLIDAGEYGHEADELLVIKYNVDRAYHNNIDPNAPPRYVAVQSKRLRWRYDMIVQLDIPHTYRIGTIIVILLE